jgi:HK97 family phage major capsid protein
VPVSTQSFDSYPCPPQVRAEILSLLLSGSCFARRLTPMPTQSGKVVFPVASPSGQAWVAENQPIPTVNLGDDSVVVGTAKLAGLLGLSNESVADASFNLEQAIGNVLKDSLAVDIDSGLIYGDAPPEPIGVWGAAPAAGAGGDLREAAIVAWGELADAGADPANIVVLAKGSVVATEWARTTAPGGEVVHGDSPGTDLVLGPGIRVAPCAVMAAGECWRWT